MSEQPEPSTFMARDSRRLTRSLSRLETQGRLASGRLNREADAMAERIELTAYVGKRAMHQVTIISQFEVRLACFEPWAAPRVQMVADTTALAIAGIVDEASRRLK